MAITGKTPIPMGDDPIVDHDTVAPDATDTTSTPAVTFGGFGSATTTPPSGAPASGATPASGFGASSFGSSPATGASSFGAATPSGFGGGGFGGSSGGFGGSTNNMGSTGTSNMNMSMSNAPVLTGAGNNAAVDGESLIKNTNTDWVNNKWRPMMGWMYMLVCTMDFVIFPVLWSLLQAMTHGNVTSQWQPVTLQGAGLFHMAMGAVLGVAAYGRTKEKVAGAN